MSDWPQWLTGFAGASPLEWCATLAGFLCVYLLIKRSIWNFAFGFVQVSIYAWIFFEVKLYSDMALHLFYVLFQIYGYSVWRQAQDQQGHVRVLRGTVREYLAWLAIAGFSALCLGYIMASYTDASLPYADAFTTCASLVAQWLLSRKKCFNWLFWILVDVVAIGIYWHKQLYPTALLYACFLLMALIGQWQWFQALRKGDTSERAAPTSH